MHCCEVKVTFLKFILNIPRSYTTITTEMKKVLLILLFVFPMLIVPAQCEDMEVRSRVISVSSDFEFFIIAAGEKDNIEIGDGFIVHRDGEKIASAHIIEVRPEVSAAEILDIKDGGEIIEGDSVLLVKKIGAETAVKQPDKLQVTRAGDAISAEIAADAKTTFSYTMAVLKENGYSVTSSNRGIGAILASKPIDMSILKELWADAFAAIGHNLVVSIEIKDRQGRSTLTASSFKEHFKKNKHVKQSVMKNSRYYKELTDLIHKIKERSEY